MNKAILILLMAALALLVSCARKETPLTILTEDYPPLSYLENGVVTGYGADVVAAIQKELKTDYQPQLVSWDEAYQRAQNEANVVLFTMEKTPEREDKFHFIGPLGESVSSFYALADSKIELPDLEAAKLIGSIATTTEWFTEQFLKQKGFANLASDPDPLKAIRLLVEKKSDLSVFTDITYPRLAQQAGIDPALLKPVLELMRSQYYIAISKQTDAKIVQQWQEAFAKLEQDGTLKTLKEKWFPPLAP